MSYMLMQFDADYDDWKPAFDSDPVGRSKVAKGYLITQAVDNPNDIYVRVEFGSVGEARSFADRLVNSGVLDRFNVRNGPTVVEVSDTGSY